MAGFAVYAISSDYNGALVHAAIVACNSDTTFVGLDAGELFPKVDFVLGFYWKTIVENLDKLSSVKGNRTGAMATCQRVSVVGSQMSKSNLLFAQKLNLGAVLELSPLQIKRFAKLYLPADGQ